MNSIYSIIDSAQSGLSVESLKAYVATQNIANVNTEGYVKKAANFNSFSDALNKSEITPSENLVELPGASISLDSEVIAMTDAGLRYQVIAEMIQKKFGLIELAYGAKK